MWPTQKLASKPGALPEGLVATLRLVSLLASIRSVKVGYVALATLGSATNWQPLGGVDDSKNSCVLT